MATGTTFYNLTKPASTENYDLAVWNTNMDMIDAQMHQNETETFTGATDLAPGTVGNVPAPTIADKDKYLKGDGTWGTPSGGGGGSSVEITPTLSTGRKIAEFEIDGVSGELYAPDPSVPTKKYIGELIPRVSGQDSHISASSEGSYSSTVWYAWGAFSNSSINYWTVPESGAAWVDASESNPWIQYHFDEPRYFTEMEIDCGSNYGSAYTGSIYIEASNDGLTWTDIGNGAQTISAPYQSINTNTYTLDDTDTWEYIRIRGAQSFFVRSSPSCFMQRIQVSGGAIVEGIDASIIDFSTLTSAQIAELKTLLGIS